jgi:NADH-quinone oxidoreductase subunit B
MGVSDLLPHSMGDLLPQRLKPEDAALDTLGGPVRYPGGFAMPVQLEKILGFGRSFSFWPLLFGLACCAIEMMALGGSRFDMSRFGMEAMRASPRQADGMIVAGWCSIKMAPRVVRLYEQIPDPKWVLAMGSCAISGNVWDTYNIVRGIDSLIPVDVYVPGCPPRPEALWQGLEMIRERIKQSRHAYDGLKRIPARDAVAAVAGSDVAATPIWSPDTVSGVDRPTGLVFDWDQPATSAALDESEVGVEAAKEGA